MRISLLSNIVILLLSAPVIALPTSSFWSPNAELVEKSYLRMDVQQAYRLNKKADTVNSEASLGLTYGLINDQYYAVEIGVDYMEPVGTKVSDSLQFSAKASYKPLDSEHWQLAGGIRRFALGSEVNAQILYVVGDIHVSSRDTTRIGVYSGSSKVLKSSSGANSNSGLMLGYFKKLEAGWGRVGAEWISGNNPFSYLFVGTHFRFTEVVDIVAGFGIPNDASFGQKAILKINLFY